MNKWSTFEGLIPRDSLVVARVVAHNPDLTSTVEFPNGSQLKVRGQPVPVNAYAFIQGGDVKGPAPAVTPIVLEV